MGPDLFIAVVSTVCTVAAILIVFSTICLMRGGVLYLGSPRGVVTAMLAMANIQPGEKVFDLGCGDGRLLVPAVRTFKAVATGIDISRTLLVLAWLRSRLWRTRVRLIRQNLLESDFFDADVVFLYLMPEMMEKLQGPLKRLKPGCRIICHEFGINGWTIDGETEVTSWLEHTRLIRYIAGTATRFIPLPPDPRCISTANRSRWPESKATSFY